MGIYITNDEGAHPTGVALPAVGDTYLYSLGGQWYGITSAGTPFALGLTTGQANLLATALQSSDLTANNILREPYEVFSSTAISLNATPSIVTMNSEVDAVAGFTVSAGRVTVAAAGSYEYNYSVSGDSTDGDRATVEAAIFIDGNVVDRTKSFGYCRTTANGEDTATKTGKLVLTAGQIVDVRALIYGDNVSTIPSASNLVLRRVK